MATGHCFFCFSWMSNVDHVPWGCWGRNQPPAGPKHNAPDRYQRPGTVLSHHPGSQCILKVLDWCWFILSLPLSLLKYISWSKQCNATDLARVAIYLERKFGSESRFYHCDTTSRKLHSLKFRQNHGWTELVSKREDALWTPGSFTNQRCTRG